MMELGGLKSVAIEGGQREIQAWAGLRTLGEAMLAPLGRQLLQEEIPRISTLDLRPDREILVIKANRSAIPRRPLPGQLVMRGLENAAIMEGVQVRADLLIP